MTLPPGWTREDDPTGMFLVRDGDGRQVFAGQDDSLVPWATHVGYAWYRYWCTVQPMPSYLQWMTANER